MATGAGMLTKQLLGDARRDNLVDPRDQAAIRSRAAVAQRQNPGVLSRMTGQQAPAQTGTLAQAAQQQPAQQTGMRAGPKAASPAAATRSALAKIAGRGGNLAIPATAGALTYDAVTSNAAADDGEVSAGERATGIAAGTGAAGLTAAAPRMLNSTLGRAAMRAAGPGMAVADANRSLAEGGVQGLAEDVYESFAEPIRRAPDDFEAALSEFMEIMSELGTHGNQIPRRPGPQL